ncbi:MAG: tetratricopeptide repeat protein [candidate division KSB1 bacterium]|nr:tetratricopeptide repeat protein [candidate division KSB1 bacterium]
MRARETGTGFVDGQPGNDRGLNRGRSIAFSALALALPLLVLTAAELVLRAAGFGSDYELVRVRELAGKRYYVLNRQVARRYFSFGDVTIPDARSEVFEVERGRNTVRIFCLGGSTTAGFPYTYNATFPSLLQDRLEAMFPDVNFEVVNVGISAINSYSVLDFVRELVRYQPDAFVIYMGHNEFYGALGVASTQSLGKSRAVKLLYLRLEKLRLFRLLRWLVERMKFAMRPGRPVDATLMEVMARDKAIVLGDPDYRRGLADFRANLRAILQVARKHRVPVLLSTLTCNLADQPPFVSVSSARLTPLESARLAQRIAEADSLLSRGFFAEALQRAREAAAMDPGYAQSWFLAGKSWYALGQYDSARDALVRAKDLDALRFRAPSEANRIIREVAREFGAGLVDMDSLFASLSPGRVPGSNLFLEHLHPNFRGYFLMARAFADGLQRCGYLFDPERWRRARAPSDSLLLERAGVTPLDEELAMLRIRRLVSRWPFNGKVRLPETGADERIRRLAQEVYADRLGWNHAHYEAAQLYIERGDFQQAEREFRAVIKVVPTDFYPYLKLGDLHLAQQDFRRADSLYAVAAQLSPHLPFAYAKMGTLRLLSGRPAEALSLLQRALELERRRPHLKPSDLGRLYYVLAVASAQTGRMPEALDYARQARQALPDDPAIATLCRQLGL